ncbi:CheB methylesterase [Syntrophobotulus glycolicus DSM 8271]|uniref:protein-glutamate methylesterase n=1 Tax=Syntrophobotulus glycolicus (strain DSM 8271 / FlGlyR) TaxID=645991 RepID=F0SUK3_SYNGF|nr:CheB methylesterase [Syntrophobotulus glycolicus DSM 8271]
METGTQDRKADRIIAIGASTGGTEAIFSILRALSPAIPGIVVVQHIPPVFSRMFAERLDSQTALQVKEAQTGDYADAGRVLIAPGDRHMRVKRIGSRYRVECFDGNKVSGHCPSVDVLFESLAREAGRRAVGILLTGMGYDGARGLLAMRRQGSRTIGQDEASSVVYGMPKAAFEIGAVERQAALGRIPQVLAELIG